MATITLNIPDAVVQRVLNGICNIHSYQDTVPDPENPGNVIPNPESKQAFAKRILKEAVLRWVKQSETRAAEEAAKISTETDINNNIIIT